MSDRSLSSTTRRWPVVSALGIIMIFTWGSSFYLMAILAGPIAAETGWGLEWITGALSAGLLVAGLASPTIGQLISRHGGRLVLTSGCFLIACGLMIIALAPTIWIFVLGWLILGIGMAAGLYDPAFASLGRLYGADARSAITQLTLWGGFASTVCWPLSSLMLEHWGWRGVAMGYVVIHLLGTMPLAYFGIPRSGAKRSGKIEETSRELPLTERETLLFRIFALMLVLYGLIFVNVSTWLFTFLQDRGVSLEAAVALGALIGPAQVGARILEMSGRGRHHPIWTLAASCLAIAIGLILLSLDFGITGVALILFGGGNGLASIARGSFPLAVFGAERYPIVMGRLARPALISQAAAPLLGAGVISLADSQATFQLIAGIAVANVLLLAWLWTILKRPNLSD